MLSSQRCTAGLIFSSVLFLKYVLKIFALSPKSTREILMSSTVDKKNNRIYFYFITLAAIHHTDFPRVHTPVQQPSSGCHLSDFKEDLSNIPAAAAALLHAVPVP